MPDYVFDRLPKVFFFRVCFFGVFVLFIYFSLVRLSGRSFYFCCERPVPLPAYYDVGLAFYTRSSVLRSYYLIFSTLRRWWSW